MKALIYKALESRIPKLVEMRLSHTDAVKEFTSWDTTRINQRRLEHLASLNLNLANRSVLEVGAGIGNLTSFFLDRGCRMMITEGREQNLKVLKERYQNVDARLLDLDNPPAPFGSRFELVFCYGLLYHLERPAQAIEFMANNCSEQLILETCVSFGNEEALNPCKEDQAVVSQALFGHGCRPTRPWIVTQMKKHFEFVYMPSTQPWHEQFPTDWNSASSHAAPYSRAVFIGSRKKLDNKDLVTGIPATQTRH